MGGITPLIDQFPSWLLRRIVSDVAVYHAAVGIDETTGTEVSKLEGPIAIASSSEVSLAIDLDGFVLPPRPQINGIGANNDRSVWYILCNHAEHGTPGARRDHSGSTRVVEPVRGGINLGTHVEPIFVVIHYYSEAKLAKPLPVSADEVSRTLIRDNVYSSCSAFILGHNKSSATEGCRDFVEACVAEEIEDVENRDIVVIELGVDAFDICQ